MITPNIPWSWENTEVLTTEPTWLERGTSTEMEEGTITTGVGQHHQEESEGRQAEEWGGPRHNRLAQRPRQHNRDVLTDEADSRRRKLL